ncbi:MAG: Smr/MutS family protein, partial [Bacteroidota bacterium]
LNEHPELEVDIWKATTQGRKAQQHKLLKVKPKQFFKNLKNTRFLSKKVHIYTLFEHLDETTPQNFKEDLKNYTRQNAGSFRPAKNNILYGIHDVIEYAEFNTEIDLHIETLVSDIKKLDKRQIVRIQMQHFEQFIAKAIRLGIPQVFIIHGVGEGKLRDRIAQRLRQHPQVKSFKNEYHHRYGFGATEVKL